jgi:hypothetical protein
MVVALGNLGMEGRMAKIVSTADVDDAIARGESVIEHLHEIEKLLVGSQYDRYVSMLDTAGGLVFAVKEALRRPA